jgi:hypothetical protein
MHRHGAVLDACRYHAPEKGNDLGGVRIGGNVEIRVRPSEENVAHGAADEVALKPCLAKHRGEISDDPGNVHGGIEYLELGVEGQEKRGFKKKPRACAAGLSSSANP